MEKLKQSAIKQYDDDIKGFIKNELKPHGYIITNKGICQINAFANQFDMVEMDIIMDLINDHVTNYWGIPYEMQKEIIKNGCLELLPMTTKDALDHYLEYVTISSTMIDDKDLQNQVNELIKTNEKKHKKAFKGGYNSPEYQSQVLINNNVFLCNNNYWIFDKKQSKFLKIGGKDIAQMMVKEYGKNFNATPIDIMEYMRISYPFFVTKTDLPLRYNNQMVNKSKLEVLKKDYAKINKIINDCA